MDTSVFLHHLTSLPAYKGQIVHIQEVPPRPAQYGELDKPLPHPLQARLQAMGIWPLYSHQAEALNAIRGGANAVVATTAASGKTLCYNLAVLEAILENRFSRALYLFPTKALAQDQWRALRELACPHIIQEADGGTFDGDTPPEARSEIKKRARIILTNPDMLHLGILPNHASWGRFLRRLKYVVVDEAHAYRGVFGSHVANILRRLRRLCAFYGSHPQFILSSATIANPEEHAQKMVGLPFVAITQDGSPYGGKDFAFWNPPLIDLVRSVRRSANSEATLLFTELVKADIRTLTFARTRKLTELIYIYSRDELARGHPDLAARIKPYRAGYLPEDRRQIEKELFGGQLRGVVATTALEMGIDIGDLDATVLTGYPGSIASTWQQAGRSGRRGQRSLSFLIAQDDPLEQYIMRHPEALFGRSVEHALINPGNPRILGPHLLCAAWELPLKGTDEGFFGPGLGEISTRLVEQGLLRGGQDRWHLSPRVAYPAQNINIRSASETSYAIIDASRGTLMETVEGTVAFFQVHPGAVYLHQGESYLIRELDLKARTAYAVPTDVPYYTQTREITDVKVLRVLQEKRAGGVDVHFGEVEVTTQVIGFKKKMQFTEEVVGEEVLDLPPNIFPTQAFWFDLPSAVEARLEEEGLDFAGGLHAAEHAAIGILPLFALCDRNDIGGLSTTFHADTGQAQVFIYDACPGGIGIAEKGFEMVEELWGATLKAIAECPCQAGCPSCVQSPKCGNNNEPLDKRAAKLLLGWLLGGS